MRRFFIFLSLFIATVSNPFAESAVAQTQPALIDQGKYILEAIQGCGCHTSRNRDGSFKMDMYLAGAPSKPPPAGPPANVGWTNPRWQKLYAANITPDVETGIGKWTESDFVAAMRTGRRPDGRILDPFMPWPHFLGITDRDLKAIWAYLKRAKPIRNKVPKSIRAKAKR